jgi:hypothetical protein
LNRGGLLTWADFLQSTHMSPTRTTGAIGLERHPGMAAIGSGHTVNCYDP